MQNNVGDKIVVNNVRYWRILYLSFPFFILTIRSNHRNDEEKKLSFFLHITNTFSLNDYYHRILFWSSYKIRLFLCF